MVQGFFFFFKGKNMDTAKHDLSEESGNGKRRLRKRGLNKNKNAEKKE